MTLNLVPFEKPRELGNSRIRRLNNSSKTFQRKLVKFARELRNSQIRSLANKEGQLYFKNILVIHEIMTVFDKSSKTYTEYKKNTSTYLTPYVHIFDGLQCTFTKISLKKILIKFAAH